MKNHWLDRKKERVLAAALSTVIKLDPITLPPSITVDWGTPPVFSCIVTVQCPKHGDYFTKEIHESQVDQGCFGEISIPSIITLSSLPEYAGESFTVGSGAGPGGVFECFAGPTGPVGPTGAVGEPGQVSIC